MCPRSSDPIYSNLLYKMGHYFLDIQYGSTCGRYTFFIQCRSGWEKNSICGRLWLLHGPYSLPVSLPCVAYEGDAPAHERRIEHLIVGGIAGRRGWEMVPLSLGMPTAGALGCALLHWPSVCISLGAWQVGPCGTSSLERGQSFRAALRYGHIDGLAARHRRTAHVV